MKGFIKKILFRFIAMLVACTVLFNSLAGTCSKPRQQEVQAAVVPAVWTLWEIIELFILSTGCTYLLYEMFTGLVDGTSALDSTAEDVMADYNEWVVLQGGKGSGGPEGDDEEPPLLSEEIIVEMVRQLDDGRTVVDVPEELSDSLQQYVSASYELARYRNGAVESDYWWELTGIDISSYSEFWAGAGSHTESIDFIESSIQKMGEAYQSGYNHIHVMQSADSHITQFNFYRLNPNSEYYERVENGELKLIYNFGGWSVSDCSQRVYVIDNGALVNITNHFLTQIFVYKTYDAVNNGVLNRGAVLKLEYGTGMGYAFPSGNGISTIKEYTGANHCGDGFNVLFSDGLPGSNYVLQDLNVPETVYDLDALYANGSYDIGATGRSWNVNEQTVDGDMTLVLPSMNTLMSYLDRKSVV